MLSHLARLTGTLGCAVVLLAGCGSNQNVSLSRPSLNTVVPGSLTACTDIPYEPFEFEQDGGMKGIDVDLVRAIAEELGLEAKFRQTPFDEIFEAMTRGDCDVVASAVSITPERAKEYLFSSGYFEVNQSLLVRAADRETFAGLDAFPSRKIGVQKGTTGEAYATAHAPRAELVAFDSASEMAEALQRGDIDGIVQDFPINSYLARKTPALTVVSTFSDVDREQYGFALRPGNEAIRDAVDTSLKHIREDGRYDDILLDYLGATASN